MWLSVCAWQATEETRLFHADSILRGLSTLTKTSVGSSFMNYMTSRYGNIIFLDTFKIKTRKKGGRGIN